VHDGIHCDRAGIPAATICTDHFMNTAQATATVWGVPEYPVLYMPHPLSALSDNAIREAARKLADQVAQVLMTGTLEA